MLALVATVAATARTGVSLGQHWADISLQNVSGIEVGTKTSIIVFYHIV